MTANDDRRYVKEFLAGWATMDMNGHMGNSSYLDLASDVRIAFLNDHGFPARELQRRGVGPVIKKDELHYYREISLHDVITVDYTLLAMSADGARFVVENTITNSSGVRAAKVTSSGGWLDLRARKLVAPPPELLEALEHIPRARDFVELTYVAST